MESTTSTIPTRKRGRSDAETSDATDERLTELSQTPAVQLSARKSKKNRETMIEAATTLLRCLGENPDRDGLLKTPARFVDSLLYQTKGYDESLKTLVNGALFSENHSEMVLVKNIEIFSTCEHHLVPFHGVVHVGYIPNGKVVGLSKLARIAEMFARRLQVQERLTTQICEALVEVLNPRGVGVIVECSHLCMVVRGVQKTTSSTTTSSVRGVFKSDPKTRAEFMQHVYAQRR